MQQNECSTKHRESFHMHTHNSIQSTKLSIICNTESNSVNLTCLPRLFYEKKNTHFLSLDKVDEGGICLFVTQISVHI